MKVHNFSLTSEESRRIEEEEHISDILFHLHEAGIRVGFNTTISDAINKLMPETRFRREVEEMINKQFYPLTSQLK